MKKLSLAVAVIAAALTLSGCAKKYTPWENTLEDAKTIASKEGKNLFVVFSGRGWDGMSDSFFNNVASTEKFQNEVGQKYILVDYDLSMDTRNAVSIDPKTATSAEKKAYSQALKVYEKQVADTSKYGVKSYPEFYLLSSEGYVLSAFVFNDNIADPELFFDEFKRYDETADVMKNLITDIKVSSGKEKAEAIDTFYNATETRFRNVISNLAEEYISLDKKNELGKTGFYENELLFKKAMETLYNGDYSKALKMFTDGTGCKNLTDEEKDQNLVNAVTLMLQDESLSLEEQVKMLEDVVEKNPDSRYAEDFVKTINRSKEYLKAMAAMNSAEAEGEN